MEFLEEVLRWLGTFPQWPEDVSLRVEEMGVLPGDVTVRQQGIVTKNRWEDITGNEYRRDRIVLSLRKVGGIPGLQDSAWLLEFQSWVARQSKLGTAPKMGTDTVWYAEAGKIQGSAGAGTGVAEVKLTAEFTNMI